MLEEELPVHVFYHGEKNNLKSFYYKEDWKSSIAISLRDVTAKLTTLHLLSHTFNALLFSNNSLSYRGMITTSRSQIQLQFSVMSRATYLLQWTLEKFHLLFTYKSCVIYFFKLKFSINGAVNYTNQNIFKTSV